MSWRDDIAGIDTYNLHSHSKYCDGRAEMALMAEAAIDAGLTHFGFSSHSPVPFPTPCNMPRESVDAYLAEIDAMSERFSGRIRLYRSMEIDWMGSEWGPHIDYFQKMPLDYRLASVHFLPTQHDGRLVDCDGRFPRFEEHLRTDFAGDIRYVVEKYFEEELRMIERGGFDILGHFDKISNNATVVWPDLEDQPWYEAYIDDVVSHVAGTDVVVEVNTKMAEATGRTFPNARWWPKLIAAGIPLVVNSDAHDEQKVNSGRPETLARLREMNNPMPPAV